MTSWEICMHMSKEFLQVYDVLRKDAAGALNACELCVHSVSTLMS